MSQRESPSTPQVTPQRLHVAPRAADLHIVAQWLLAQQARALAPDLGLLARQRRQGVAQQRQSRGNAGQAGLHRAHHGQDGLSAILLVQVRDG